MITLNLIKPPKDKYSLHDEETYEQIFPNGHIHFHLSKTPTSNVFNNCYVELFIDKTDKKLDSVNYRYRVFESKQFATAEAFERSQKWCLDILNDYENVLMKIKI